MELNAIQNEVPAVLHRFDNENKSHECSNKKRNGRLRINLIRKNGERRPLPKMR